ncbi:MAG: transposase [Actinobacteria bacterium]|nr:transposase [Actinomycetota bacterium]
MTLGRADHQGDLFDDVVRFCEVSLPANSIYGLLARERDRLFPDEMFADLFADRGRRSVPPSVVATVMVLQRLDGLSDREAVDRYAFDVRWRYAAGVGGYGGVGWARFAHTVLVDMRERLRTSQCPDRVFEVALDAARQAGLIGRRRVLDSTPLYDAVATMDTVTLIRSALRGLLGVVEAAVASRLRAVLSSGDDYATTDKPQIDWDDKSAREQLIDSRARDGFAVLAVLDGRKLDEVAAQAAALLATVLGQDLQEGDDGVFRIARRVAKDRVISTVDPQARHGHKTAARGFDGYQGHVAMDPDSEIITATTVTPGNTGDATPAPDLIADLFCDAPSTPDPAGPPGTGDPAGDKLGEPADPASVAEPGDEITDEPIGEPVAAVYGDNAYGTGEFHDRLEGAGIESKCKTQTPTAPGGRFGKDHFEVDLGAGTVGCPGGFTTPIRPAKDGGGTAYFGPVCAGCPLREQCTTAAAGRTISIGPHEQALADARARQTDPAWVADYRATRPKVERKIAHLMRRKHGGRRARVRGTTKINADFRMLATAVNLARLATLGLCFTPAGWATA